jgi:hypothetical protein
VVSHKQPSSQQTKQILRISIPSKIVFEVQEIFRHVCKEENNVGEGGGGGGPDSGSVSGQ